MDWSSNMSSLLIASLRDPQAVDVLRLIANLVLFLGKTIGPRRGCRRLLLFLRHLAGDRMNIGAINANVVELVSSSNWKAP